MAYSVVVTSPIPTFEETVERYRLSKAERRFVEGLFREKNGRVPAPYASKNGGGTEAATKRAGKDVPVGSRKTKSRARKAA